MCVYAFVQCVCVCVCVCVLLSIDRQSASVWGVAWARQSTRHTLSLQVCACITLIYTHNPSLSSFSHLEDAAELAHGPAVGAHTHIHTHCLAFTWKTLLSSRMVQL